MIMQSRHFKLERRELCDVLTSQTTGEHITFLVGELEHLVRFLGPLYEDITRPVDRKCECCSPEAVAARARYFNRQEKKS